MRRSLTARLATIFTRVHCGAGARVAVEQVTPLDQRRRLWLIRCDERLLLLLTGGPQDLLLGWLPETTP